MSNTYVNVSVPSPNRNKGRGLSVKDKIIIFDMDDVLHFPSRDGNGVVISGNIIFKAAGYCIALYATNDTIELTSNTEGETDNEGFIPSVKFKHPGNEQEIREFKANWVGRRCGILILRCDTNMVDLYGSPCAPMRMQVNFTGNKDATGNEFTFTQAKKGDDIAIYKGTITMDQPIAVIPAGAVNIPISLPGQYQLTGDAAAVTIAGITGATDDMVITLLGATGGTPPTIDASADLLLKNGQSWIGGADRQITFRAFKNGANSIVFIEQSRY